MPLLNINDKKIWYKQTKNSGKNYLLLHNAGGDHSFLFPQFEMLSNMGFCVTIVDFAGHGISEIPEEKSLTIESNAKDIIQLCTQLNIDSTTIVGLNYGGNIALEILMKKPSLVSNIIMIDPPILISNEIRAFIEQHLLELDIVSQEAYANQLIKESFIKISDDIANQAYEVFYKSSHKVMKSIYKDLLNWDLSKSHQRLLKASNSTICIFTDASLCDAQKLQNINSKISTAKVIGSKYWASIEVPDQINAIIQRYIDIS